ncbi:MAG: glycine betaine ABC transporter substrate-binding protein [Rhodothalassiaceae bacterium]
MRLSGLLIPVLLLAASAGGTEAKTLVIGSKAFSESVILGETLRLALREEGVSATHRRAMGGTAILIAALMSGEIDLYPDYSGTLIHEVFAQEGVRDLDAVAARLAERGIGLSPPLGFENSYALAMRREKAARLGILSIADLARHPGLRFGLSNEFLDRKDGWRALKSAYGLPQTARGLHHDLSYRGLADGAFEVIDVYTTDAEIARRDLLVLADTRGFFPGYQALILYRMEAVAAEPALLTVLGDLAGRIDEAKMRAANGRALTGRESETRAAEALLAAIRNPGEAGSAVRPAGRSEPGLIARLLARGAEHVTLVAISLLAAIALAVPLSVLIYRRPRLAPPLLAMAGILQTVPALALFVFMIPVFGIGARPTIAALFLYSLLPILRAGHAGLMGIAPELRLSAEALGLDEATRLFRIELPLAFPVLLSGIKTAAVINVGAATLGALIGAGGYGQPILTGIRLDDIGLILEGAIPAALLALLVTGLFELLSRLLVPRGLRPRRSAARPSSRHE